MSTAIFLIKTYSIRILLAIFSILLAGFGYYAFSFFAQSPVAILPSAEGQDYVPPGVPDENEEDAPFIELGTPCDEEPVEGDVYQGRRLHLDSSDPEIDDIYLRDTQDIDNDNDREEPLLDGDGNLRPDPSADGIYIDVPEVYNDDCIRYNNSRPGIANPRGGFHTVTVEYDIPTMSNSFFQSERGVALTGNELGLEASALSIYDYDTTGDNTTPFAIQDFPFSCNTLFVRRREGFNSGNIQVLDRSAHAVYCCENGWGAQEAIAERLGVDIPPDLAIDIPEEEILFPDARDKDIEEGQNESQPEPDEDGDPRNGYSGVMNNHVNLRLFKDTSNVDVTFEQIPSTTHRATYSYQIEWPGVLYEHVVPPGGDDIEFYRGRAVGYMIDEQAGDGEWQGPDSLTDYGVPGNCGPERIVLPPEAYPDGEFPNPELDYVLPDNAAPCPPGIPMFDQRDQFTWNHGEPYIPFEEGGDRPPCADPDEEGDTPPCESGYDTDFFLDIGNGYTAGDTWEYFAPTEGDTVEPELFFNSQVIEIGDSPRARSDGRNAGYFQALKDLYPITNIEVKGIFEQYTPAVCTCRPDDKLTEDQTEEAGLDEGTQLDDGTFFVGCQVNTGNDFDPEFCGYCGSNQPILNGGETDYPQNAYCEDALGRATNTRWPPFNWTAWDFDWEITSSQVGKLFDSVLNDTAPTARVDINVVPVSPRIGQEVRVTAIQQNYFTTPADNYYNWLINGVTQQGLVAGADERIAEHEFPPDFVEQIFDDEGNLIRTNIHEETREFYQAPVRRPDFDNDGDGLDDGWENRYGLNPNDASDALEDPDEDDHIATDFGSTRLSSFNPQGLTDENGVVVNPTPTYQDEGRFIYINPGVWWYPGGEPTFIPPPNFNPEWFTSSTEALGDPELGFTNAEEYVWGTSPVDPDTDDDGIKDYADIMGIGQMQWSYINPNSRNDYSSRDNIGVIIMGRSQQAGQQAQEALVQIACNSKVVIPGSTDEFDVTLSFDPAVPVPGDPLTITANVTKGEVKEGFLTYDWDIAYSGGEIERTDLQGGNTLELTAEDTANFASGEFITTNVLAFNTNQTQRSFGNTAEASRDIPVGVRYDSLAVFQPADDPEGQIFPFPSDQLTDENRYEAYKTSIANTIKINRFEDVEVEFANIWSNDIANNLYFEWLVDDVPQFKREINGQILEGSGTGSDYARFVFNPLEFLPEGITEDDSIGKSIKLIGRAVNLQNQEQSFRIEVLFEYETPDVIVEQEEDIEGEAVLIKAAPQNFGSTDGAYYTWKINGEVVDEGEGLSEITLPYLEASIARAVEVSVSNTIGGNKITGTSKYNVSVASLSLPWTKKVSLEVYGFYNNIPYYAGRVIWFFFVTNVIFFVFYLLYALALKRNKEFADA